MSDNTPETAARCNALAMQPEEDAAAFLEKQLEQEAPALTASMRQSLARLGASIAKKGAEASTATPQKAKAAKAQPTAEIIQFPLPFPEATRPASNDMARSALFAAIQGKDRQMVKNYHVATVDGVKISFTGEQWNQDDHDTLMQLVFMAQHRPLGDYVTVPANAILKALGRGTGKSQHEQLRAEIMRLKAGMVGLDGERIEYFGNLIDDALQDKKTRYWCFRLNPKMAALYGLERFTLIDWEQRKKLKQKDLARWLQLYISSHAAPFPVSVKFLHEKSGSKNACLRDFRRKLKIALEELKTVGFLLSWEIDAADLVKVERKPSPAQLRHILRGGPRKSRKKGA